MVIVFRGQGVIHQSADPSFPAKDCAQVFVLVRLACNGLTKCISDRLECRDSSFLSYSSSGRMSQSPNRPGERPRFRSSQRSISDAKGTAFPTTPRACKELFRLFSTAIRGLQRGFS